MFEFGDWGYAHRLVQEDIVSKNFGVHMETAVYDLAMNNKGRVDIYNDYGEIWEVKSLASANKAESQLIKYTNSHFRNDSHTINNKKLYRGHAGAFNGAIVASVFEDTFLIVYVTPEPGLITYTVSHVDRIECPQRSYVKDHYYLPDYSYQTYAYSRLNTNASVAIAAILLVGYGASGLGCRAYPISEAACH